MGVYARKWDNMTVQHANASIQVQDADGSTKAFDLPLKFDDATASLSAVLAWIAGLISALDPVIDVKVNKARVCFSVPLPGGIKSSPNAASINERTGLVQYAVSGSPFSYGVDIPGMLPSLFTGDTLAISGVVATLNTYLTTPSSTIVATDRNGNALTTVKKANKTFRK